MNDRDYAEMLVDRFEADNNIRLPTDIRSALIDFALRHMLDYQSGVRGRFFDSPVYLIFCADSNTADRLFDRAHEYMVAPSELLASYIKADVVEERLVDLEKQADTGALLSEIDDTVSSIEETLRDVRGLLEKVKSEK